MRWLDIVNKSKNIRFYCRHAVSLLMPKKFCRSAAARILESVHEDERGVVSDRVDYCNKLTEPFSLDHPVSMRDFYHEGNTAMQIDFKAVMRYFDPSLFFNFTIGDTKKIPGTPSFLKSRPVGGDNRNSVLLKLGSARHFNFVNDPIPFEKKKNIAHWRGAVCKRALRIKLLEEYFGHPKCDLGDTDKKKRNSPVAKPVASFSEQLRHKFIISLEGNDVATNTKWIMSSNSLCLMPRPRFETWFMEGTLKPDYHYVLLKDDLSDLEEKIDYYSANTEAALEIIRNAHRFVAPFKDRRLERLISLAVMKKYLDLCLNNQ